MTDTLPDGFEIITDQTPPPERGLVVSGAGQDLPAGFEVITDEPAPTNQRGGVERVVDSLFASAPAIEGVRQAFGQDSELFRLSPEKQVKWLDNQTRKANKKLEKATRAYENLKKRGRPEGGRVSSTTGLSAADRYDAQLAEQLGRARRAKEQLDKVDAVLSGADDAPEFGPIKNAIAGAGKTFLNAFGEAIPKAAGAVEATLTGADPQDTIGFRAGQAFADNTDFALATDSARSADTVQQVAEGLGQAASILVPASRLSAAGRGSVAVGATSAGLGAVQGGAAGLDEAVAFDGTAKQQLISFYANAGLGVTEAIPLNRLLGRLNKTSGGQVERILKTGASQGIEEMAQEIGQTIGSNVIADELAGYDEGRAILEGAGEAGKIGGIIGALLGAGGAAVTRGPQTEPTAPDAQPDAPEQPSDDGAQLEPENPDREPTRRIRANPVKPGKAWTSDGTETAVEYAVVEASDLITSHDPEGNLNPAYPQILQPRDRARKASQTQVSDIANNLTPERLGETPDAGSGAPIISENGVVESGNGRSMGLKQAYAQNPEKAQEYREWLEASGYPTEGMTAPVLVRIGDPSRTDGQRVAFTRAANARATADMSVTERSISDAKELRPQDFDLARTGGVESPANRDFARTLVSRLATEADLGRLIDAKGVLSVDGKRRLDAAIAAYAFEDPRVVSDLLETTDSTLRSIGQSLVEVAPKWASLRAGVEAGTVDPRANILPNIIEAANIVKDAREAGQTVPERIEVLNADFLRDPLSSTTKDVLDVFYDPKTNRQRSPKQIAAELAYFAQEGEKASAGENLFGDDSNPAERIFDRLALLRASGQNITIDDDFTPSTAKPLHELPEGFEVVEGDGVTAPKTKRKKGVKQTAEFRVESIKRDVENLDEKISEAVVKEAESRVKRDLGFRPVKRRKPHSSIKPGLKKSFPRSKLTEAELKRENDSIENQQFEWDAQLKKRISAKIKQVEADKDFMDDLMDELSQEVGEWDFTDVDEADLDAVIEDLKSKGRTVRVQARIKQFVSEEDAKSIAKSARDGDRVLFSEAPKTDSAAFKRWFGDSKVVDERGEPLVVYHRTGAKDLSDFAFDPDRIGEQGSAEGRGFYFTNDKETADGYGAEGSVIEAYLKIQKPMPLDTPAFDEKELTDIVLRVAELEASQNDEPIAYGFLSNYADAGEGATVDDVRWIAEEAANGMLGEETALEQFSGIAGAGVDPILVNRAVMEVTGFDGIVSDGFDNLGPDAGGGTIYVAFTPEQIKSVNNRGTFDPNDDRILFSETPSRAARKTAQLEYPIAPRGEWYGEANYKDTGGELIEMTPQEYLDRVRPLKMDEESRENIDILKEHIQSGKTLDPLKLFDGGKEDGRHRAHAAKELGIESVPVIAFGDQIPSRQPEPPAGFEVLQDAAPQPKPEPAAPEPPTPAIEPQPAPTNDVEAIKGLHIITADIARRFGVIYKQGRLGRVPKRVQGWYKPKTGALRGRKSYLEDIKTFAHEIGHHWEFSNGPELRTLMDRFASELTPLDYEPNRKDRKLAVSEGFAEYFRQYITHRDFVKKAAPKFTKEYEAWLDREHPGLRQDIQTFTDQYQAYLKAPSSSRVKSNIVRKIKRNGLARMMNRERPDGSKSLKNQIKNEAEDRLIDGYAPFKRLVADLLDLKSANKGKPQDLKAIDDPFALLRLSENSMTAAMADAEFGVKGYNDATPSGPSFKEAVREATNGQPTQENIDDFEAYLISRRAVQEWDRYFKGEIPNEPVLHSKADHQQTIKDMEAKHKQFKSAAKKIYAYQRNLLKKSFDAGHMDRKTYDELLKRKDYVPFKRDMSDRESAQHFQGGANSRQGLGKNASAKHVFKGSGRPIISPLQSIVEETVRVTTNTQQTRITNALIDLAESAGRGSAALVEVVPLKQLSGDRINLADAFKQRLNNSDLNPDEKDSLAADFDTMLDGNEMATVFKMSEIRAKTGETILYGMKDGKQVGLIVNDPDYARTIAEAIGHANNQNANAIVTGLAMTARVFRAGVTTHPVFAVKNVIRDQVGGWLQTDAGAIPFLDGYKGAMSYINRDMMYQAYVSNFGTSAGIEQSTLQDRDLVRSVEEFAAEGITVKKVANLRAFAKLTDASEVASRMGNYMKFYKKFKKQGMSDQEAAVEAAWEATRVIDFSMTGRDVKQVRRMVPFLGSQISGMTRSKQVFFAKGSVKNRKAYWNYLRTGDPKDLSQKDIREIELQRTAWMKAVIGLGIPSLITLALYGDDEDFEKFEGYERRSNWIFRLGDKWVFIPKPFELASAANALERSYEGFILNDRKAAKKWLEDTASMFKPPTDNPLINTIYEQRANHNMFFGMPIVGQDIQSLPAPEQANAYTSSLAKQMGQLIGRLPGIGRTGVASPARIDHAIKNATGTWGRDALRLMDTLAAQRPATTAETAVVSSGFIKNPDSGARETSALFDKVGMTGQWTGATKHLKDMLAEGDMKAAGRAMIYAKDEAGKDYAVADRMKDLDIQFRGKKRMTDKEYTALKRQHPMRRAKEASTIIRKARKELMGNKFEVKMTDRERQQFVDKLSQLHNAINANGMIVSEVKGWEHRKLVDEAGKWQDLSAISEKGAKLIWAKTKKKKMTPEAKIVSAYADLKKKTAPYIERLENQK